MASESTEKIISRYKALEESLKSFGTYTKQQLLFELAAMGLSERAALAKSFSKIKYKVRDGKVSVEREKPLYSSIGFGIKKKSGDIESLAFRFARHGIFLERGVGKYRPVNSPAAEAAERPWLGHILDNATDELADLLAEEFADIIAAEVVIRVPGVLDTKVSGVNNHVIYHDGEREIKILIDKSFF